MEDKKKDIKAEEVEVKEETVKKNNIDEKEKKKMIKEEKRNSSERSPFQRVMNVILWIVVIAWMAVCVLDFITVHDEKEPKFCISKSSIKYDDKASSDGEASVCYGAGYKVYKYTKGSCNGALEFGPFWIKPRTNCR